MITLKSLIGSVSFLFILIVLFSCKNYHRNNSYKNVPRSSIVRGESLAKKYCQSCHLFPDPSLVDAKSWKEGVLPHMGPHLGIFSFGFDPYPNNKYDRFLSKNFYPSKALVKDDEWQSIIDYYTATSPDSLLPQSRSKEIRMGLSLFQVNMANIDSAQPVISFIKIDSSAPEKRLLLYDLTTQRLYNYNKELKQTDSLHLNGAVVDASFSTGKILTCNIGFIYPTNGKFGKAQNIIVNDLGKLSLDSTTVLDSLARPVEIIPTDLDKDGLTDYLVCEFGYMTGSLSWFQNQGNNKFVRHIIRALPGAIKVYLQDYNHDGLPDLWVLFAQGEEGIFLFTNKGKGKFEEQEKLRFPPVYGSSYFELADFNGDGNIDIIYTCGDNADYSAVLKPYHGVYIFLNDGKNNFKQKFFFPINGCYKAIARDFDGDGDLDIATISFFADYAHQPWEGFVYLENLGDFKFQPYSFPESERGRWLTMDAGDLDGDGKIDLVLGNFSSGPTKITPAFDWKKGPAFIYLKNMGTSKKKIGKK